MKFFLTSLLEYNCFTMLCYFLLYNKVNQLYVYIYPHIPSLLRLPLILFIFIFKINLFIYLFLAVLGLHCCARAFSSCGEWEATLLCGAQASHCSGFSCCIAWAVGTRASVVVARGL